LPRNAPISCQVEASALPRASQTPTPSIAQENPPNLNKILPRFRESSMR
jgi:hypothetical protein